VDTNCIFCKIIHKQVPAHIIAENDHVIVIKDMHPKAPIHYLIIPKKHLTDLTHLAPDDRDCAADILYMARQLSQADPKMASFRLVSNNGLRGCQSVFHVHIHFLAGTHLSF